MCVCDLRDGGCEVGGWDVPVDGEWSRLCVCVVYGGVFVIRVGLLGVGDVAREEVVVVVM